ncbi:hypothetical protein KCU92_g2, partial [Aureobasidium melanogenum]
LKIFTKQQRRRHQEQERRHQIDARSARGFACSTDGMICFASHLTDTSAPVVICSDQVGGATRGGDASCSVVAGFKKRDVDAAVLLLETVVV